MKPQALPREEAARMNRDQRIATIAWSMCKGLTRKAVRAAPYPDEDQMLQVACRLIDDGLPIEDEEEVALGFAVAKSRLTLDQIAEVARGRHPLTSGW